MTQMNGWMLTVVAVAFMAMMTSIAGTRLLRAEPQAGAAATTLAVASAQTPVGASESKAAIAAIEKLGGTVEVDETRPGRPVVKVNLYRTGATDADRVHL